MITLPVLPTSASPQAGIDTSTGGDSPVAVNHADPAFFSLVSNHLLTQLNQATDGNPAATPALADDEKALPAGKLSALLAAFDKPEALNTLLHAEKSKGESKSADDKDRLKEVSLSDSDKQALQALFAMLPPAASQPVARGLKNNDVAAKSADHPISLLAMPEANQAPPLATGKTDGSRQPATLPAGTPAAVGKVAPAGDAEPLSVSASFQQTISDATKHDGTEQTIAANNNGLNVAAPGAATAAVIPGASATAMVPATPQLNSQLGSPEWQQALGQQILMFNRNGQQNAEIRLHPQDLGAIQISLKLDNDRAQLNMVSEHSHVRAALEAAMPQLRTALAENGITLGQSSVNSDAFPQSQTFSEQQQARQEQHSDGVADIAERDGEVTAIAVPATLQARIAGDRAVDIFA